MSDLEKRNATAVSTALKVFDARLQSFVEEIDAVKRENAMLRAEVSSLNALRGQFLAAVQGGGPTT